MGLGGTAKKLQKVANMAEEMYARLNDLRKQLNTLREATEETQADIQQIKHEQQVNRELIDRIAEQQGIDVEAVVDSVEPPQETDPSGTQSQPESQNQPQQSGSPGGPDGGEWGGRS